MIQQIKGLLHLTLKTLTCILQGRIRFRLFIEQLAYITWSSVGIIVFCVSFAAVVTIIEASYHMKLVVQNDSLVPGFSVLLIVRELGAVVTALLITSKVGAGYAAEISLMKTTEQIDALKLLGIDPIEYLTVPRFLACLVAGAFLTIIAVLSCLAAAMLVAHLKLDFTMGRFMAAMRLFVDYKDIFFAAFKGVCFLSVISIVSSYYGFNAKASSEGVGLATTQSVVTSSVLIIILDFILGLVLSGFY